MRIGYFGRPIGLTGGIARYTSQLLKHLAELCTSNEYLVYSNRGAAALLAENIHHRPGPPRLGRVGWEQFWLPWQISADRPAVYHSPDFTLPLLAHAKCVVTIHDLIFMRQPEGTSRRAQILYRVLTRASARKAKRVIAISDFTALDIMKTLEIPESKIRRIPQGVDPALEAAASPSESRDFVVSNGIKTPYVLFVGLLTPRKGVLTLIEAFEKSYRQAGLQTLVLVGLPGSGYEQIEAKINASPVRSQVLLAGAADDRKLASLYRSAAVFCLPSYHEGYGLPVLEAMLLECPVIVSDSTSLPEAVGDAGLIFPAGDSQALAETLSRLCFDADLAMSLRSKGRQRALSLSWTETAARTLKVYEEVARCQ